MTEYIIKLDCDADKAEALGLHAVARDLRAKAEDLRSRTCPGCGCYDGEHVQGCDYSDGEDDATSTN